MNKKRGDKTIKEISNELDDKITRWVNETIENLGTNKFPSQSVLRANGLRKLEDLIQRNGGFKYWRNKFGLKPKNNEKSKKVENIWNEEAAKEEILLLMDELKIEKMPMGKDFKTNNKKDLLNYITRSGGLNYWSEQLGLGKISKSRWNDDEIKDHIFEIMKELQIDRMPSKWEMVLVEKNYSLSDAIVRYGGFQFWAEKLNLNKKECETSMGKHFEEVAMELLKSHGFSVKRMKNTFPFDLLINEKIKIDVKSSSIDIKGNFNFQTNKEIATSDFYLMIGSRNKRDVEVVYIAPSFEIRSETYIIKLSDTNNRYKDRFDYLHNINNFYKTYESR